MTFHFLRPEWFWLLLPTLVIWWGLWKAEKTSGLWQAIIDPVFQKVLLEDNANTGNGRQLALLGLGLIWLLSLIALAGPTWKEIEQPAEKGLRGNVILLDASLSMLADDLKPNRISRAKFKLIDLLKSHPELATGLVVYAGSAHTLVPISEDNQTLLALLKAVSPLIMPSLGSNPELGIQKSLDIFEGAHIQHGHLIWVLDDIEESQIKPVAKRIKAANISVSLLAVGTQTGGPISLPEQGLLKDADGKIILAKLPFERLHQLADEIGASLTLIQNNDSDLDALLPSQFDVVTQSPDDKSERKMRQWLDYGIYLFALLLPLAALGFRRGYLFIFIAITFLPGLVVFPSPTMAAEKPTKEIERPLWDILKSPDQQGYEDWTHKRYEAATDKFEDPAWKGASLYRLGQYAEAAKQFGQVDTAEGHFNQGNALAHLGQFKQAKEQYLNALKLKPDWTSAEENLHLMDELLKQKKKNEQQQSSMNSSSDGASKSKSNTPQKPSEEPADAEKNSQKRANQTSSNANNQGPDTSGSSENLSQKNGQPMDAENGTNASNASSKGSNKKNASDLQQKQSPKLQTQENIKEGSETHSGHSDKPEGERNQKNTKTSAMGDKHSKNAKSPLTEKEQAQQAWLNQIPDEPGLFLKRKFEYQYQLQSQSAQTPKKVW